MASVSSLDKDMKKLRLSKYTPQAANEIRTWIESALGEQLQQGDLLEALKDGTALCKLVNLVVPGSVRFKASSMPFVQMENISHFLRASQQPPLSLQSHDIFQTVDLYEAKDPAQVLQCISAFSRKAHAAQPNKFKDCVGEKSRVGLVSPQTTGSYGPTSPQYGRPRKSSNLSETNSTVSSNPSYAVGGRGSPYRPAAAASSVSGSSPPSSGGMSSWSKKADESNTTPAWNIHQYGYMGGASQGNQGISFGARRQITSAAPNVPSLAEKERQRREKEADAERRRREAEQDEAQRNRDQLAEEERARIQEEERWAEETRRQREVEKQRIEDEKKRWEAEERRWKEEDELRAREEQEAEARLLSDRGQQQAASDVRLTGQFLSQYQADQTRQVSTGQPVQPDGNDRIKELERQLEEAKAREAQYERERQERLHDDQKRERSRSRQPDAQSNRNKSRSKSRTRSVPVIPIATKSDDAWEEDERDYLRKQWVQSQAPPQTSTRPLPSPQAAHPPKQEAPPLQPTRPLPVPEGTKPPPSTPVNLPQSTRPLPNPSTYHTPTSSSPPKSPRKSPFTRPTGTPSPPPSSSSFTTASSKPAASTASYATASSTSHPQSQPASARKPPSSLLSREMELDRQRQQEWEEDQKATQSRAGRVGGVGLDGESAAPGGGAWDTSQYGFLGGDSQNKGSQGIGFGMGRRQLVGPREMGKKE